MNQKQINKFLPKFLRSNNFIGEMQKNPRLAREVLDSDDELMSIERQLALEIAPDRISRIKEPSFEDELASLSSTEGSTLGAIDSPSIEAQIFAVNSNPSVISLIDNPSLPVQISAVIKDGLVIENIEKPSEEVKILAVMNNPEAINFIKKEERTERVYLVLINKNPEYLLELIASSPDEITRTMIETSVTLAPYICEFISEDLFDKLFN